MTQDYFVKTDQFEGPLDLLLHLVRVQEVDVFAVDVLRLIEEYLAFLRLIRFSDLQQAGDFIEMAATLIEMKTRMLLPHEVTADAGDEGAEEDPLRSLQERLFQYETFRNAADHLAQMPQLGVEIQTNHEWSRLTPLYEHIEAPLTGEPATLVVLYEQMLRELLDRKRSTVTAKVNRISVEETIERLYQEVETTRFALLQGYYNRLQSRDELVVYLLAMLELSKMKRLKVYQQDLFGPVWLHRMDCDESALPVTVATSVHGREEGYDVVAVSVDGEEHGR